MPALTVFTNPLSPGLCQLATFNVGDDPNWSLSFNNGSNFYNPGGVTMNIGYIRGLGNFAYSSAFQLVDRMNNTHTGSFTITSGLPSSLTWDETPIGVAGDNGAWLVRGRTPPSATIRKVYVKNGGTAISTAPAVRFDGGSTITGKGATATATVGAGAVTAISITNPGQGYSSSVYPEIIITGDGTGATANINQAANSIVGGKIMAITVVTGGSGYTTATVTFRDPEATATASVGGTSTVSAVTLVNPGSGYTSAPTIAISGGGGASAAATSALANSTWGVLSLTLTGGGSAYTTVPTVTFTGGTGSGCTAVATINYPDQVFSVAITTQGVGYFPSNPLTGVFSGGGGSGAAGYARINDVTGLYYFVITSPGAGYTSAPTITFFAPDLTPGTTMTATATLGDGKVSGIMLVAQGSGYGATAPTIGFTGGGGSGATATATLIGSPLSPVITMTNNGSGYTTLPSVAFSGGAGTGASAVAVCAFGVTAITMTQGGYAYTSLPSISLIPNNGALLIPSGVESHTIPFVQNLNPATATGAITVTPFTNGRRDTSGNLVYDDALLIVRPRYLVQPTLTLQTDNLTWAANFTPVNAFVNAVLSYRRSCVADIEIFGGGRLLFVGNLTIQSV